MEELADDGSDPRVAELRALLAPLADGPARLAAMAAQLSADDLLAPLEPGGWSVRDVLAHLLGCDRTWGPVMVRILDENHPTIRTHSPRRILAAPGFRERPFAEHLAAWAAERATLIERLRAATDTELTRRASIRLHATEQERDVGHFVQRLADHEREHLDHLERVLARP